MLLRTFKRIAGVLHQKWNKMNDSIISSGEPQYFSHSMRAAKNSTKSLITGFILRLNKTKKFVLNNFNNCLKNTKNNRSLSKNLNQTIIIKTNYKVRDF